MTDYPGNDRDYREAPIESVDTNGIGSGGWWLGLPADCPVKPVAGQIARFYPKGLGYPIRGLFIDGVRIWYRTDAEDKEYRENQMYGKDAADMLRKWDAGETVHTIEMGGLGPGYEQALQIAAMEMLRYWVTEKPDHDFWKDEGVWKRDRDAMDKAVTPKLGPLGLSGAQFGAAVTLSSSLYMRGPRQCLSEVPKDRHTMISNHFPTLAAPATAA